MRQTETDTDIKLRTYLSIDQFLSMTSSAAPTARLKSVPPRGGIMHCLCSVDQRAPALFDHSVHSPSQFLRCARVVTFEQDARRAVEDNGREGVLPRVLRTHVLPHVPERSAGGQNGAEAVREALKKLARHWRIWKRATIFAPHLWSGSVELYCRSFR